MKTLKEIQNRCEFRLKESDYKKRLSEELDWFNAYGGTKALLIASNLIRDFKKSGIYVGNGQNYACSSLVCFGLGITDVNPVTWGLPFMTFKKHFTEDPVIWINTSNGGPERINEIIKYADYPELVSIVGPSAELKLIDDKSVNTCKYIINEYPILELLKSFQEHHPTNIKRIPLDATLLKSIIENGTCSLSLFSHARLKERMAAFKPDCFSDLCVLEALYRANTESIWSKVLESKKTHSVQSTGYAEIDRILAESYGQIIYEEQLDAIRELDVENTEAVLSKLEFNKNTLANKGTVIANVCEAVQSKAYELKMPSQFNNCLVPLQAKVKEQHIQIIRAARKKLKES